jgi:D-galactarolactone cycloisomerase
MTRRELLRRLGVLGAGAAAAGPLRAALAAAPASAVKMRIARFELMATKVPMYEPVREAWQASYIQQERFEFHYTPVMVKVHTDEGLTGIGNAAMPKERAEAILKRLVGRSPWEFLFDDSLGGLLVPMYDLVGQATGLPVARLLAANPKPRIVQTWWSHCWPPALMAAEARRGQSLGYRVHKVKARPWHDPIEQAAAICEAVSKDFRVWADANAWWGSVGRTRFFVERLAKFSNYFAVESPIPARHLAGYRELKGAVPLLVAEHMPADPMPFIREHLVDAFVIGGPLGRTLVQRALTAELTQIPLWVEHSIEDGINQVFQAHQAAAFPGIQYTISITHVLEDDLMKEPFTMKDGFYELPAKPGLGVSLDEDAIEKYRTS